MVTARHTTPQRFRRDGTADAGPLEDAPELPRADARANPTFGPEYWPLGFAAACPAFLIALLFLLCAGAVPLVPPLPTGLVLGGALVLLSVGAIGAHRFGYPAWTHPGLTLLPTLALLVPAAILRGEVIIRINGDPSRVVLVPLVAAWLLLLAATIVIAGVGVTLGRYAPSFSGLALLPTPLILAWLFVLAPPFAERAVLAALGSALALAALATFIAWIMPAQHRPLVPLLALAAQLGLFWLRRFGWPDFGGALRPLVALDILLYLALVALIATAPIVAAWVRREGWPTIRHLLS